MQPSNPTAELESTWAALCYEAGWTSDLYCTADGKARRAYEARLDALIGERQCALRTLVSAARHNIERSGTRFDANYVDGISAAIERAAVSPRQVA